MIPPAGGMEHGPPGAVVGEGLTTLPAGAAAHGPAGAIMGGVLAVPPAGATEYGPPGAVIGEVVTRPPEDAAQAWQGETKKNAQDPLGRSCVPPLGRSCVVGVADMRLGACCCKLGSTGQVALPV
mmetsp:Transcript_150545/g.273941  ORF Transcript_150545/g.273941 Transcript_150545/m.273941 type:complete len:125 (+) Transcript_150545:336-710(+)